MSAEQPDREVAPERGARRAPAIAWETVATAAVVVLLAALALAGVDGATLVAAAVGGFVVLAVVAALRRSAATAVVAAVMAATALTLAAGLALGDRARASGDRGVPFPAVVGLPIERARALFDRHGPVHYVIKKVPYGARGTVLRASGYSTDGTYAPGSTITLVVGTRAQRS